MPDGLTGYVLRQLCQGDTRNLIEVESLSDDSAGLVMKGTAPIEERREQFLKIYDGCKAIAEEMKSEVKSAKEHPKRYPNNLKNSR